MLCEALLQGLFPALDSNNLPRASTERELNTSASLAAVSCLTADEP